MTRISAEHNITIEVQPESWRMYTNGSSAERVLVEADSGALRYGALFAVQRHLPHGAIAPIQVQRVVTGWSAKDSSWHLGLMLTNDLAAARGSRWVEIASWFDPTGVEARSQAEEAGQTLANQIQRPFSVVPPKVPDLTSTGELVRTGGVPAYAPAERPRVPIPLPELPIKLEQWTLDRIGPNIFELKLSGSWARQRVLRALWNFLWAGAFLALSLTSLTRGIALPQPEFLPYVGLGAAALLIFLGLATLVQAVTRQNRVVIDGDMRKVIGLRGNSARWDVSAEHIQSIYASEIVGKVNPRKLQRTVHFGELNILLADGVFEHLITAHGLDEKVPATDADINAMNREDGDALLVALNAEQVTALEAVEGTTFSKTRTVALYIAQALGVRAVYDQRVR